MQRRVFLKRALQAGAFIPIASSGLFMRPLEALALPRASFAADHVLVLINLNGGNDGLNSVIPVDDQNYYNARAVLGVKKADALPIADHLGLHPKLANVRNIYGDGYCAIVENVGYPGQDRSHFRSTDIWNSASDANKVIATGWTGRYLETIHPEYPGKVPTAPFAVQVSNSTTLLIQGSRGSMGMALDSPDRFYDLASGLTVDPDPVPSTFAGDQLQYVRQIIVEADIYATEINRAISSGTNHADYATDSLSAQLKGVARLINGGMATGIYVVTLSGFDTHLQQPDVHASLLASLSAGIKSFLDDMNAAGNGDRVVCLTYSEFGRRLAENASAGTDHGAASPQFLFGRPVLGGQILGGLPDLEDLDNRGDVKMKIDFRQIYSTVLQDWMGFSAQDTQTVLGGDFTKLPLFRQLGVDRDEDHASHAGYRLDEISPNPVRNAGMISFAIPTAAKATLSIFSEDGRMIMTLFDRTIDPGDHRVTLNAAGLPSGTYFAVLESGGYRLSKRMIVVR